MTALADALERWTPTPAPSDVVKVLREQAAYVIKGGPLTESPLAPRVSNAWVNIAGAGGTAGGGSDLAS